MLKKLSLYQRLVLANALYAIPVIALIFNMVSAQNVNIDFGAQEIKGNIVQKRMQQLLKGLLTYRAEGPQSPNSAGIVASINEAIPLLKAVLATHGTDLQFTEEGLKNRSRANAGIDGFEQRWTSLTRETPSVLAKDGLARLNALISDVRTMITHVGDTSNLILDPDLDSYYAMDMTLLALPQTQDRISEISTFILSKKNNLSSLDRVQIAVYAALLKQADLDRITADLQTVLNEDSNFYGVSPGLKNHFAPEIAKYQARTEALISELDKVAHNHPEADASKVAAAARAAFEASNSAWDVGVNELDVLLQKRLEALRATKMQSITISLLGLIAAVIILFWISSSFNKNMGKVLRELQNSVLQTRSAGQKLVQVSTELSSSSSDQASALSQTSSALEEISSMAKTTIDNTGRTYQTASVGAERATAGHNAVKSLNSAIQAISVSNQEVLKQIDQNRSEVNEITRIISDIGSKTKVINDIVFQTKLLSFNASVEAARAGEVGKGFAVVAEEVGNLASMSGTASEEISTMLKSSVSQVNSISLETNKKISVLLENNTGKVTQGTNLAATCEMAIGEVLSNVQEVLQNADSIRNASEEQAKGISEVTDALRRLNMIAQKNLQISDTTASESQAIAEHARFLESIVTLVQNEVQGTRSASKTQSHEAFHDSINEREGILG